MPTTFCCFNFSVMSEFLFHSVLYHLILDIFGVFLRQHIGVWQTVIFCSHKLVSQWINDQKLKPYWWIWPFHCLVFPPILQNAHAHTDECTHTNTHTVLKSTNRHILKGILREINRQRRFTSQRQWQVLKSNFLMDNLYSGMFNSEINGHLF